MHRAAGWQGSFGFLFPPRLEYLRGNLSRHKNMPEVINSGEIVRRVGTALKKGQRQRGRGGHIRPSYSPNAAFEVMPKPSLGGDSR